MSLGAARKICNAKVEFPSPLCFGERRSAAGDRIVLWKWINRAERAAPLKKYGFAIDAPRRGETKRAHIHLAREGIISPLILLGCCKIKFAIKQSAQ
jgi:hypothetical protein